MEFTEYYRCDHCGTEWRHTWDDDPNNDYTNCPTCGEFDFEEIKPTATAIHVMVPVITTD